MQHKFDVEIVRALGVVNKGAFAWWTQMSGALRYNSCTTLLSNISRINIKTNRHVQDRHWKHIYRTAYRLTSHHCTLPMKDFL